MNEHTHFDLSRGASDRVWKIFTTAANTSFKAGDFLEAERLYAKALKEAQQRFGNYRASNSMADIPPMLIAASANAAECQARKGDPVRAALLTLKTLETLRIAMLDSSEHPAFRQACFRHLKTALFEYAERAEAISIAPETFQQIALRVRNAALKYISENQTKH